MRRKFYTVLRDGTKTMTLVPENTQMIALQTGEGRPFFIVDSYPDFLDVVKLIGSGQPVMSLIAQEDTQSTDSYSIPDEAATHVKSILAHQPRGPYMLGGCSASGIVAYETAQQLRALGHEVGLLVIFDTPNPYFVREYSHFWLSLNSYRDDLNKLNWTELPRWAMGKVRGLIDRKALGMQAGLGLGAGGSQMGEDFGPLPSRIQAARKYRPASYAGRVLLVKRTQPFTGRYLHPSFGWSKVVQGKIDLCGVSALDHLEIFKSERDRVLVAGALLKGIAEVVEASSSSADLALQAVDSCRPNAS